MDNSKNNTSTGKPVYFPATRQAWDDMQVIHRKYRLADSYYAAGRPDLWGVSHIYPGSGYNWADGIGMSDWNAFTGSEMYRQGLAAGLTDIGGKLYGFDEEGRLLKEPAVY